MFDTEFAIMLLVDFLIQVPISVAIAYVFWQRGYRDAVHDNAQKNGG